VVLIQMVRRRASSGSAPTRANATFFRTRRAARRIRTVRMATRVRRTSVRPATRASTSRFRRAARAASSTLIARIRTGRPVRIPCARVACARSFRSRDAPSPSIHRSTVVLMATSWATVGI